MTAQPEPQPAPDTRWRALPPAERTAIARVMTSRRWARHYAAKAAAAAERLEQAEAAAARLAAERPPGGAA